MELVYQKRSLESSVNSYRDLLDNSGFLEDGESKRDILKKNPFKKDSDDVFQLFVCDDKSVIASGFHFPTSLILDDKELQSITCSTLSVNKSYRKRGIGSNIHKLRMEYAENGAIFIGSVSQMQYSIMEKLGAKLFFSPRLVLLKKSRSVVEMFSASIISKILSPICDIFLLLQTFLLKVVAFFAGCYSYEIKNVIDVDGDYEKVWKCSEGRFKENHNSDWMKWVLQSNPEVKLYYVKKNGEVLGWFVIKEKFYEQASSRGFKNVTLGSIVEWESVDVNRLSYFKIILLALTSPKVFGKNDAIEFAPFSKSLCKKMRCLGLMPIGKSNAVLRLSQNSSLRNIDGIFTEENWRIRPAAGDNMLF